MQRLLSETRLRYLPHQHAMRSIAFELGLFAPDIHR